MHQLFSCVTSNVSPEGWPCIPKDAAHEPSCFTDYLFCFLLRKSAILISVEVAISSGRPVKGLSSLLPFHHWSHDFEWHAVYGRMSAFALFYIVPSRHRACDEPVNRQRGPNQHSETLKTRGCVALTSNAIDTLFLQFSKSCTGMCWACAFKIRCNAFFRLSLLSLDALEPVQLGKHRSIIR